MEDLSNVNVTIPYYEFQKITKRLEYCEKEGNDLSEKLMKMKDNKELIFLLRDKENSLRIISKVEAFEIAKKEIETLKEELERVKNKCNELILLKNKKSWWK